MPLPAADVLRLLFDLVPEFEQEAATAAVLPMERFADATARLARTGEDLEQLRERIAFVEELARSTDPGDRNLAVASFLEAASWGRLGVAAYFGPAMRDLAERTAPGALR